MRFEIYTDKRGEWRWRLVAANGRTVADSGEGYKDYTDAAQAIQLVKGSAAAPVEHK